MGLPKRDHDDGCGGSQRPSLFRGESAHNRDLRRDRTTAQVGVVRVDAEYRRAPHQSQSVEPGGQSQSALPALYR